jgi:hypothetical protein
VTVHVGDLVIYNPFRHTLMHGPGLVLDVDFEDSDQFALIKWCKYPQDEPTWFKTQNLEIVCSYE